MRGFAILLLLLIVTQSVSSFLWSHAPLISQLYSLGLLKQGRTLDAISHQITFISDVLNFLPVIGHIKGCLHLIFLDIEGCLNALYFSTRTIVVVAGSWFTGSSSEGWLTLRSDQFSGILGGVAMAGGMCGLLFDITGTIITTFAVTIVGSPGSLTLSTVLLEMILWLVSLPISLVFDCIVGFAGSAMLLRFLMTSDIYYELGGVYIFARISAMIECELNQNVRHRLRR